MRKRLLYLLLALAITLLSVVALASCDDEGDEGGAPVYRDGDTIYLNVYNWGEYISDGSDDSLDVNREFERYFNEELSAKFGGAKVKVQYSTYPTNEDMYAKLKNGMVAYDIVIPSDYMIEKMIAEDMLYSYDVTSLENYKYIIDTFKSPYYDKENRYSVPYTYGMLGIIYNRTVVDEGDLGSWELLWNEKYDGDILQFNNPRDAFATAMYSLSLDVNSTNPEEWRAALEKLKEQKALLQGYVNDEIFNKMTTESAAIAPYYVGDFLTMVSQEENLDFFYPKEGVNYFVDAMCIPKASKNPEIAKEYINFMLSEEIAVANADYMGYASPNSLVVNNADYREYMNTEYLAPTFDDEGNMLTLGAYELLYNKGPEEVNAAYDALFKDKQSPACYRNFPPEIQALLNDLWEELKIYDSTETWIHVTSASIVAVVLGFAAYSIYIKKKRSRHYRKKSKKES